jgi:hypothetical protein
MRGALFVACVLAGCGGREDGRPSTAAPRADAGPSAVCLQLFDSVDPSSAAASCQGCVLDPACKAGPNSNGYACWTTGNGQGETPYGVACSPEPAICDGGYQMAPTCCQGPAPVLCDGGA